MKTIIKSFVAAFAISFGVSFIAGRVIRALVIRVVKP